MGPYPTLSIPNVRCAGLGIVPKKGGKWRMIMHLSVPRGHSINDTIPKERYSLQYSSVDDAVALLFQADGQGQFKIHHIHLNTDTRPRADIRWWYDFLLSWNGRALFLESSWTSNESLSLYTDASGSHGYGTYYHGAWLRVDWLPHQSSHNIQWKELYAIVIAVITWGHIWTGKWIRFNCDNKSIVQSWAKGSSKNRAVMSLLRHLFLVAARGQFTISMAHIPGSHNAVADALSRNKMV